MTTVQTVCQMQNIYSEGFIDDLDMGVAKARRFYVPIEVENNIP